MKKIIVLLVLGILLLGCAQQAPPSGVPNASAPPTGTPGATTATVHIKDLAFNPADVTVSRGGTVTWVNDDSVPHIVRFPDFQSATLANGDSFEHTFSAPGEFSYICGIHPSMQGKVTVK